MMNLRELRAKRKSVAGIERLTSAMKMVSQAKLAKVQGQWRGNQEIAKDLTSLLGKLTRYARTVGDRSSKEASVETKPVLMVIFSSDKGFCGGFNLRIFEAVHRYVIMHPQENIQALCIGKKVVPGLQQDNVVPILQIMTGGASSSYESFSGLTQKIYRLFQEGKFSRCLVCYTKFHNAVKQEAVVVPLLPFVSETPEDRQEGQTEQQASEGIDLASLFQGTLPFFGPDLTTVLDQVRSLVFSSHFLSLAKEHSVSEHSARMTAMDNASQNAKSLLNNLQLTYNTLRQALITKELVEIISGAQVLDI